MKRILFLLLLTVSVYGQNPSRFAKIQITGNTNSTTATKVNVQEANGEVNTQTINTGFNKNFGLNSGDVVGANTLLNQYSITPVDWTATTFNSGQVVFYAGKQWIAKIATVAGDVPAVSSKWEEITFEALANKTTTVDQTIIDGSTNAVSGNAVFDALATKANDSNVIHTTGNETKNGNLGVNSLVVANNPIGSVANEIKQTIGVNDWWKIYGKTDVSDRSEMVFEVGDNGDPFSYIGQRYRFHYNASAFGTYKDPVIIDYNDVTMDTNLGVAGNILTGGAVARGFIREIGVMGSDNAAFTLSTNTQLSDIVTSINDSFQFIDRTLGATVFRMAVGSGNATFLGSVTAPSYTGGATLTGTPTAPTAPAGTNTTQVATTAFVQANARPYKVYTAVLTQQGTANPSFTVLENTIGSVSWSRTGTGTFVATSSNLFTLNKTFITTLSGTTNFIINATTFSSSDVGLNFLELTTGNLIDGVSTNKNFVEIRVYL